MWKNSQKQNIANSHIHVSGLSFNIYDIKGDADSQKTMS